MEKQYERYTMDIVVFMSDEAFVTAGIGSDEDLTPLPDVDVSNTGGSDS